MAASRFPTITGTGRSAAQSYRCTQNQHHRTNLLIMPHGKKEVKIPASSTRNSSRTIQAGKYYRMCWWIWKIPLIWKATHDTIAVQSIISYHRKEKNAGSCWQPVGYHTTPEHDLKKLVAATNEGRTGKALPSRHLLSVNKILDLIWHGLQSLLSAKK